MFKNLLKKIPRAMLPLFGSKSTSFSPLQVNMYGYTCIRNTFYWQLWTLEK